MGEKRNIDWDGIERDYRAGILSVREIASDHGITHGAINKRAKRDNWDRDLNARIQARAEALVSKQAVSTEVSNARLATDRETVEANAAAIAAIRIGQRTQIKRSLSQAERLLEHLERTQLDEENAREFSGILRQLADSQKVLIGMEREAWGLKAADDKPADAPAEIDQMDGARRLAFALARAAAQPAVH